MNRRWRWGKLTCTVPERNLHSWIRPTLFSSSLMNHQPLLHKNTHICAFAPQSNLQSQSPGTSQTGNTACAHERWANESARTATMAGMTTVLLHTLFTKDAGGPNNFLKVFFFMHNLLRPLRQCDRSAKEGKNLHTTCKIRRLVPHFITSRKTRASNTVAAWQKNYQHLAILASQGLLVSTTGQCAH